VKDSGVAAIPGRDAAGTHREPGPGTEGCAVPHVTEAGRARSVLSVLMVLTFLSGVIDAVCYLGLGRVFTANMTGNVVVLGFAAAGAPGFSTRASLTSLAVFLVGAVAGGRLTGYVASTAGTVATGWGQYATITLLAFAMGIRNAVVRGVSIPHMTTTVLTMTLTGLAADSTVAGGTNQRAVRRAVSAVAMFLGAVVGAALFLNQGPGLPLVISAAAAALTSVAVEASSSIRGYLDEK
jgi:uncharacterized membrane protein YoaK (UPF0700 family)